VKKLTRPTPPSCLNRLKKLSPSKWDLSDTDKTEIWLALNNMQNFYCAYCDSKFIDNECHIEHLTPQHILKSLKGRSIYEWDNLFGSCDNDDHCGRYKDHIVTDYDPLNLIKSDIDEPSNYFNFLQNGHVVKSNALDEQATLKAEETIRVLNLDSPRLVNLRAKKIGKFQMEFLILNELIECSDTNNKRDMLLIDIEKRSFIQNINNDEYFIAVKQNTIG